MIIGLILWIILCALVAAWAERKGHKGIGYLFLSIFLSPLIGAIIVACISDETKKQCPYCKQWIDLRASVCSFCGRKVSSENKNSTKENQSSSNTNYNSSTSAGAAIQWHCLVCDCKTNPDCSNWCKVCNEPRYSMKNLSENNKKILKEYIEKQISSSDIIEMKKLQASYFETSSLKFMKLILPDLNEMSNIDEYKNKLREVINEKPIVTVEAKTSNTDSQKETNSENSTLEEELEKLKSLFDKNLIDEDEYKAKKAKLLGL